jgi:hypothetical protein
VQKGDIVFAQNVQKMSFATMTRLTEGLYLGAMPMLKAENSVICLVGTRIPTMFMME